MTPSQAEADARHDDGEISLPEKSRLWPLTRYFLKLGTIGFGGQVALIAIMRSQSSM
jgi:chromate transport protein ChrA